MCARATYRIRVCARVNDYSGRKILIIIIIIIVHRLRWSTAKNVVNATIYKNVSSVRSKACFFTAIGVNLSVQSLVGRVVFAISWITVVDTEIPKLAERPSRRFKLKSKSFIGQEWSIFSTILRCLIECSARAVPFSIKIKIPFSSTVHFSLQMKNRKVGFRFSPIHKFN